MGGVNKLRGSSSLPAWFNGGIALTKDVSSFNSYRVSLLGGFNDELKQGGIELDHLFNLSDYIGGYKSGAHISLYTVLGIGGYVSKRDGMDAKIAGGVHGGLQGTLSPVGKLGLVCGTQTISLYRWNRRCGLPQTV